MIPGMKFASILVTEAIQAIDISTFARGAYILHVETGDQVQYKKFIKY